METKPHITRFLDALDKNRGWLRTYATVAWLTAAVLGIAVVYTLLGTLYRIFFDPAPTPVVNRAGLYNSWMGIGFALWLAIPALLALGVSQLLSYATGLLGQPTWLVRNLDKVLVALALWYLLGVASAPVVQMLHPGWHPENASIGVRLYTYFTALGYMLSSTAYALFLFALSRLVRRGIAIIDEMKSTI